MDDLILIGGGGHARSVIDVIETSQNFRIKGIVDRNKTIGEQVIGYRVIASDEDLASLVSPECYFLLTVGQIKTAHTRVNIDRALSKLGGQLARLFSSYAHVSKHASVAEGTVVMHFALINAGCRIGRNAIINTRAIVEHDTTIGDFCHISTGAILNGEVTVGNEVFIGSHATLRQGVTVVDKVIVGAHSWVNQDIKEAGVYAGVPARKIK